MKDENGWVKYDFSNIESRPKKTGKYFVHRKDGKVHWETWNGSGFAYNNNVITHWKEIKLPIIIDDEEIIDAYYKENRKYYPKKKKIIL